MADSTTNSEGDVVTVGASPLQERLAALRDSGDEDDKALEAGYDKAAEDILDDDDDSQDTGDEGDDKKTDDDKSTDDKDAEGDEDGDIFDQLLGDDADAGKDDDSSKDADDDKETKFSVAIPSLREGAHRKGGSGFDIDIENQEVRDLMEMHMRRSNVDLPELEDRIADLTDRAAAGDFLNASPQTVMDIIHQEQPDIAKSFVESWMDQHPMDTMEYLAGMELEGESEKSVKQRSQLAQLKVEKRVHKDTRSFVAFSAKREAVLKGVAVIRSQAEKLGLDEDLDRDFKEAAARRLERVMQKRIDDGLPAEMQRRQVLKVITPVVTMYKGSVSDEDLSEELDEKGSAATQKKIDARAKELAAKARKVRDRRKVAGSGTGKTKSVPASVKKRFQGLTMKERLEALRRGKI